MNRWFKEGRTRGRHGHPVRQSWQRAARDGTSLGGGSANSKRGSHTQNGRKIVNDAVGRGGSRHRKAEQTVPTFPSNSEIRPSNSEGQGCVCGGHGKHVVVKERQTTSPKGVGGGVRDGH